MIWGTNGREVDWIPGAFAAEWPGIKVNTLGDNDIAPKIIAETRAGRHAVDVYWSSITGVAPIVQRELPTPVDWSMFGVAKDNTAFDGRMGFTNNIAYVVAYDTRKVAEADLPKTWDQLLDPKYKDKMAGSLFLMPRLVSALSIVWGEDKSLDFARKLAKDSGILLTRAPRELDPAVGRARDRAGRGRYLAEALGGRWHAGQVCHSVTRGARPVRRDRAGEGTAPERGAPARRLARLEGGQEGAGEEPFSRPTSGRDRTIPRPRRSTPAAFR